MNKLNSVEEFIQRLMKLHGTKREDYQGCSIDEIEHLMKAQSVSTLPKFYVDFMMQMGRVKPREGIFRGEDIDYLAAIEIKDNFVEFLDEPNIEWEIPDNIFVFWEHHGYQFYFFYVDQDNDSPIYRFAEGDNEPHLVAEKFSDLLDMFYRRH